MISGLITSSPGSRAGRHSGHLGPLQKKALAVVAAARQIEAAIAEDRLLNDRLERALEEWMQLQRELVAAARRLEQAAWRAEQGRGGLQVELVRAFRSYEAAVAALPSLNLKLARAISSSGT